MRVKLQPRDVDSNHLLAGLDAALAERLRRHFEPVQIPARDVLVEHAEPLSHVYFITSGIVSRIGLTRSGRSLELACTGREGAAGVLDVLGLRRMPYRVIAQLPTEALRIRADTFRRHVHESPLLFERVAAYSSVVVTQLAQSALCARFHTARQRLCRWLATAASRADTSRVPWSHEWIAEIVGGPRSAVSQAAASLRDQGLIEYGRQGVMISDLRGLRRESCECLHIVERAIREFSARHIPDR